jgi:peptidoglycan hydrolase CwlO-like protein
MELGRRTVLGCHPPHHCAISRRGHGALTRHVRPGARPCLRGDRMRASNRMSSAIKNSWTPRALAAAVVCCAALGSGVTARSAGDLQGQINASRSAAGALRQQIAADSRQIAGTANGVQDARNRLTAVQSSLDERVAQLRTVQSQLLASRDHLVDLENRLHVATTALSTNLVSSYEGGQPSVMDVILSSHGFRELLNQLGFIQRVANQDASVIGATRVARAEVSREATRLGALETRDRTLADEVLAQRNRAAALQAALLHEQLAEMAKRSGVSARLSSVNSRLGRLQAQLNAVEKRAAEQATQAAATGNANVGGLAVDTGGMVQPPAGAPDAIKQIIAAGNAIATLPYIYGGGHASFHADGYDCSGSVSYALAAAGLVSSPMVSGDFEDWGDPGPGRWVTIYANAGHVWMDVAGWRFDTVALAESGTRWAQGGGEFSGFVVRHPPGL